MSKPEKMLTAYNGSPSWFQSFSLSAIGTGEGMQAYGWGLYFSESKDVASSYNRTLSFLGSSVNRLDIPEEVKSLLHASIHHNKSELIISPETIGKRLISEHLTFELSKQIQQHRAYIMEYDAEPPKEITTKTRNITAAFSAVQKLDNFGGLYQVKLPDNNNYLLWDKSLSEQPLQIRAAFEKIDVNQIKSTLKNNGYEGYSQLSIQDMSGDDLYTMLSLFHGIGQSSKFDQKAASMALRDIGLEGIKYLDGNSRENGKGTFNYVLFDDKHIKITALFDPVAQKFLPLDESPVSKVNLDRVDVEAPAKKISLRP